jgi:reverse gyrase
MQRRRHKEKDLVADIYDMYADIRIKPNKKRQKQKIKRIRKLINKPDFVLIKAARKLAAEERAQQEKVKEFKKNVAQSKELSRMEKVNQDIKELKPDLKKIINDLPLEVDMDVPADYGQGYGKKFRAGLVRYYHTYGTYKSKFRTPSKHKHFLKLNKMLMDSKDNMKG